MAGHRKFVVIKILFLLLLGWRYGKSLAKQIDHLFYGEISMHTTFILYLTVGLLLSGSILLLRQIKTITKSSQINYYLLTWTTILCLFSTELFLKHGLGRHLTYQEKKGEDYQSLYLIYRRENELKRLLFEEENLQHLVASPNTIELNQTNEFVYQHAFNQEGLRDDHWVEAKDSNECRIIGIGDSFTEGNGTAQDSTWLQVLQALLQAHFSNQKIQCLNAGKGGSDPVYGKHLLSKKLLKYQPDIVLVVLNTTDLGDIIVRGCQERFTQEQSIRFRSPPWWEPLYGMSYIVRHIAHAFFDLNHLLLTPMELKREKEKALICLANTLMEYYKLSQIHHFKLVLLIHPLVQEVIEEQSDYAQLNDLIANSKADLKINLREAFLSEKEITINNLYDFYWPIDQHHNTKGYQLWGEKLAAQLIRLQLLK